MYLGSGMTVVIADPDFARYVWYSLLLLLRQLQVVVWVLLVLLLWEVYCSCGIVYCTVLHCQH
jgi:hypothetical protein